MKVKPHRLTKQEKQYKQLMSECLELINKAKQQRREKGIKQWLKNHIKIGNLLKKKS